MSRAEWRVLGVTVAIPLALAAAYVHRDRRGGCSTAPVAHVRNLARCQDEFVERCHVDVDGDGRGEYGSVAELCGALGARKDERGADRGGRPFPPILSPARSRIEPGGTSGCGVTRLRVLLPARGGGAATEPATWPHVPPSSEFSAPVDTDLAERAWIAFGWWREPFEGRRSALGDQSGRTWETVDDDGGHSGEAGPTLAALPAGWRWGDELPETFRGRDGTRWRLAD